MLSWMTAAIAAIVAVAFAPSLPEPPLIAASLLVGVGVCFWLPVRIRWPLVAFLLAGSYACGYGYWRSAALLPVALEGVDLTANIRVLSAPEQRATHPPYFRFDAEPIGQLSCSVQGDQRCNSAQLPSRLGRLRLNWYGVEPPALGANITVSMRLRRPHGYRSVGAFDYGRWLFVSGYSAIGYVRNPDSALSSAGVGFSAAIARQQLIAAPLAYIAQYSHGAIMNALLFADRSAISSAQWALFSQTGTSHLMAISGMHIAMVLAWGWVFGRLGALLWLRSYLAAPAFAFSFALIYAAMAGFPVPTQRALLMAATALLAYSLRRHISRWQGYFAAMFIVLLLDPLAPHQIGFSLSFAAVGVLLWAYQGQRQRNSLSLLHSQWVVILGLLPALGLWGFGFSGLSLPANLVAIPLVALIILPVLFVGLILYPLWPALAAHLFSTADTLLDILLKTLAFMAEWLPLIHFSPPWPALILGLIAVMIVLLPRGVPAKWLAIIPLLALFCWPVARPAKGALWLTVLDVGQGLAVVLQTHSKTLLYDVGPDFNSGFNTADAVVIPALRKFGIDKLDTLVLSHADRDHAGAAPVLLDKIAVNQLFWGERVADLTAQGEQCGRGQKWRWDGLVFEFLAGGHNSGAEKTAGNNSSCVLMVREENDGRGLALITGDIEADIERQLLTLYRQTGLTKAHAKQHNLQATVLIAPHHGSNTSSTEAFIAAVAPSEVVFSAGLHNNYGHPAAAVRKRYTQQGSHCWFTGQQGSIQFRYQNGLLTERRLVRAWQYYWEEGLKPEICPKFNSAG